MLTHHFSIPSQPSRVVIMGAGGFIGNAIALKLESLGIPVLRLTRTECDLLESGAGGTLLGHLRENDTFVAASALAPCKNPTMLRDNMIMAEAMVSALSCSSVSHVLNISSDAVYADSKEPLTEASPMAPDSLHGVMHLAREIMFRTLPQPLAILRPTLVYGARDPHNGYGPNAFRRKANKKETITLFGKGEEQRDHVMVDDVALLAVRMVLHRSTGALNAATGTVTSFRSIAEQAVALSGNNVPLQETVRSGAMPHNGYRPFAADATFKAFPDFVYTTLSEGLKKAQGDEFGHGTG